MALPAAALAAIISGAAGIASAGVSAGATAARNKQQQKFVLEQMKQQDKYSDENAEVAYQRQLELIAHDEAYNDPSAVRARYEQAGISPIVAFGNGSANGAGITGGHASTPMADMPSAPSANLAVPDFTGIAGLGGEIVNAMLASSQKRKTDAEAFGLELENKYKEIKTQTEIDNAIASLELKLEDKKLKSSERDKIEAEISYLRKQAEKIDSDIEVNDQNIEESHKRVTKLDAETDKLERINAFEQSIYNTPLEIMNSVPGVATFISKNVRDRVESAVGNLDREISNSQLFHEFMNFFNGVEGYDPVKKFIKKNWNAIAEKLNEIDRKLGFKTRSVSKFD